MKFLHIFKVVDFRDNVKEYIKIYRIRFNGKNPYIKIQNKFMVLPKDYYNFNLIRLFKSPTNKYDFGYSIDYTNNQFTLNSIRYAKHR